MDNSQLPLNALRAFEAAARHCSLTKAGLELRVTQTAISHQVKSLEEVLGVKLFRRLPRGLALTDEGMSLAPILTDAFRHLRATLSQFEDGHFREVLTVGAVSTFATGWLLPRLQSFRDEHPYVDVRLMTNNNRVDLAGDGLDIAIRFGDGTWLGTEAVHLLDTPLAPMCSPLLAQGLGEPADMRGCELLRSYRLDEWKRWFEIVGVAPPPIRGLIFDSSLALAQAAAQGAGVALLPVKMFQRELEVGRLVQPFEVEVPAGGYWLTWLKSRRETGAMKAFRNWLLAQAGKTGGTVGVA